MKKTWTRRWGRPQEEIKTSMEKDWAKFKLEPDIAIDKTEIKSLLEKIATTNEKATGKANGRALYITTKKQGA